jgi:phosphatidylinositol 4-kinase
LLTKIIREKKGKKEEKPQEQSEAETEVEPQEDIFSDSSYAQRRRIRRQSIYSIYNTWGLANYMIKWGDDVRQEQFAMQLIYEFNAIFRKKNLKLRLTPYEIIPIGPEACLVEMVTDALSMDGLKKKLQKKYNKKVSLFEFFGTYYRGENRLKKARKNFCYSLAAYSLLCYFLQLKDRHNGNILLHRDGRIVHIDFGFLFTTSPGGAIEKKVPFKLTSEYVAVMGDKAKFFVSQFKK